LPLSYQSLSKELTEDICANEQKGMKDTIVNARKARLTVSDHAVAIQSLHVEDRPQLMRDLSRYLADRSPSVRSTALDKVRDEKLRELENQVYLLLSDKNHMVRCSAADCVGFLHANEGVKATWLYPLLEDAHALVRIETLESLPQIGDRAALPLIAKCLQDEDPVVRAYAATAIEYLDGEEYVAAIEEALKEEKEDRAKVGFAGALFYFGDADQLSILLEFLSSSVYTTRCAAANTICDFELTSG
jgi:HEAT repeat protein